MSNQNDENNYYLAIAVYVSESLLEKVTSSLDIFINVPNGFYEDMYSGGTNKITVSRITSNFLKDTLSPEAHIPNLDNELAFIICENNAIDLEVAELIRKHRISKRLGPTFVDIIERECIKSRISLDCQEELAVLGCLAGINYDTPKFETYFSEGIRFWHAGFYEPLINSVKSSLYVLGFYFPTPDICIDWSDMLWTMKSKGFGIIFQQGEELTQLVKNCFIEAKQFEPINITVMYGDASGRANLRTFLGSMNYAEQNTIGLERMAYAICSDRHANAFLPFIDPDLSWCWLGFGSGLPEGITASDITLNSPSSVIR